MISDLIDDLEKLYDRQVALDGPETPYQQGFNDCLELVMKTALEYEAEEIN